MCAYHSTPMSDAMWRAYWANPSRRNRNRLVLFYAPLSIIAAKVVRRDHPKIKARYDLDELASMAMVVLIEEIGRYDQRPQVKAMRFEWFVYRRLIGALIDQARHDGTIPRPRQTRGRPWKPDRLAAHRALHGQLDPPVSLDIPAAAAGATLGEVLPAADPDPAEIAAEDVDRDQMILHDRLALALRRLTPKQRQVIQMHDFGGLRLKTIGVLLGVSESRVCQIRAQALRKLRQMMDADNGVT